MRGSNSAYEKTKVRQWEEVNLCYNQVQDTNQVKVQGIIDPKPPSRCLPSTQLLTSISSTSPRWSWACPLKCYVSLFKVRLGRGAPYGDFLISNTSRCAVYSLLSWSFPCPKELLFSCTHLESDMTRRARKTWKVWNCEVELVINCLLPRNFNAR